MGRPMLLFVIVCQVVILPLTWVTLPALNVPEHLELTAGSLLTGGYALLAGILARVLIG